MPLGFWKPRQCYSKVPIRDNRLIDKFHCSNTTSHPPCIQLKAINTYISMKKAAPLSFQFPFMVFEYLMPPPFFPFPIYLRRVTQALLLKIVSISSFTKIGSEHSCSQHSPAGTSKTPGGEAFSYFYLLLFGQAGPLPNSNKGSVHPTLYQIQQTPQAHFLSIFPTTHLYQPTSLLSELDKN